MRLKKVEKRDDSWQHCCRWCHYYQNKKCWCREVCYSAELEVNVYGVSENGYAAETIKESLESVSCEPFRELEYMLREWKVSEKRIREFNEQFKKSMEEYHQNAVEIIDEDVLKCYDNHLFDNCEKDSGEGVEIVDPENFCCSHWC